MGWGVRTVVLTAVVLLEVREREGGVHAVWRDKGELQTTPSLPLWTSSGIPVVSRVKQLRKARRSIRCTLLHDLPTARVLKWGQSSRNERVRFAQLFGASPGKGS